MREKIIELLGEDVCMHDCCGDCECQGNEDMCIALLKANMADHLIANDVVLVVRCKDCIWFSKTGYDDENTNEDDLNLHVGHCVALRCVTQACRFCSYGERRTK